MALLNADNNVDIVIKTTSDNKAIDSTTASLTRLEHSSSLGAKASAAFGAVARTTAAGVALAGAAIGGAGVVAIKSAGSYEQSRIAFDTMLGSAESAQKLMTEITQFAKTTPFELPEVVSGTKQLLAYGFAQEQLLPTMRKLGDIASGLGVPVGQLTNVFGQVKVAGKLMGQELLQFTNAGVPMIEYLAKTMGVAQTDIRKMVEEGKVGFPEVEAAINAMTEEGSKFGGMMDMQAKTFNGVVSNIKDGFGQILRSAVGVTTAGEIREGSLFDRIKDAAEKAVPVVQKFSETIGPVIDNTLTVFDKLSSAAKTFFETLKDPEIASEDGFIGKMQKVAVVLREIWDVIYAQLKPAFDALWNTIKTELLPPLKEFWELHGPQVMMILKALALIIGGSLLAGLYGFINVLNILLNVVSRVIEFNSKLVTGFRSLVTTFANAATSIGAALAPVYDYITAPFRRAWDWISGLGGRIASTVGNIGEILRNTIGDWDIPGPLGKVRDVIPGFASGVRNFSGGLAVVGERGPELVNLPRGADVFTNNQSKQMLGSQSGTTVYQTNNIYSDLDMNRANIELGWRLANA